MNAAVMSTASTRLSAYIAAEAAVLKGQSFSLGGRTLTRADLAEIREGIHQLQAEVRRETLSAQGRDPRYAVADFSGAR